MLNAIQEISTIIERDSKDTTYKFALLRSCIEISQKYEHYGEIKNNQITFPLGLIILKWIEYYYPIFATPFFVPQKNGDSPNKSLSFRKHFLKIIPYYEKGLGYLELQKDIKDGSINDSVKKDLINLIKELKNTIIRMPMHYIGSAIGRGGEIFNYHNNSNFRLIKSVNITDQYIIDNSGTFSFPLDYFEAFKFLGSFISGTESLIFQWAEFTRKADKQKKLTREDILSLIEPGYDIKREVNEIQKFYKNVIGNEKLISVWSGTKISNDLNIDHVLPYSIWKNNDLWNLLPTNYTDNNSKRDKIPDPNLIEKQKELIIYYWELIYNNYKERFTKEAQISLLGNTVFNNSNWKTKCIGSLVNKCRFLTEIRGYESFNI